MKPSKPIKSEDIHVDKSRGVAPTKMKGTAQTRNECVAIINKKQFKASKSKNTTQKKTGTCQPGNSDSATHTQKVDAKHKQGKVKMRKRKGKNTNIKSVKGGNAEKLKALLTLEMKGKFKKPLTDRQKHKLMKLKLKQKAKKADKTVSKTTTVKKSAVQEPNTGAKVDIPKTAGEVSCNWKILQQTSLKNKTAPGSRKRKISQEKVRNPKFKKLEDGKTSAAEPCAVVKKPDIWFDDVDEFLIEGKSGPDSTKEEPELEKPNPLVKPEAFKGLTKAVAMDCEMVGVGDGTDSMVARVSVVNQHGEPIYDKYVKPKERVIDYRTHVSGIRPGDMEKGEDLEKVQKDVADILKGRVLVGHAIQNDLQVLFLQHPRKKIRDTSRYKAFRRLFQGRTPSLKNLSSTVLHVQVQDGEHNSIQDAQAAMRLYTMFRKQWESELKLKRIKGRGKAKIKT